MLVKIKLHLIWYSNLSNTEASVMSRRYLNFPAKCRVKDAQIVAGVELRITCLNAGEELKYGGADKEIAQLLHSAFLEYKKSKDRDAFNVLVHINERFIDVYDHVSKEMLLTFRLIDVKDITKGQDRYSKFSVLVGKEYNDMSFKAYIFCDNKTSMSFYNITRRAFQLGFDALKRAGSVTQYLENDYMTRTCQLNMYNTSRRDKTDNENCMFCCEALELSDSDDEFEWRSDQTCLLNPKTNMAEFHTELPKQGRKRSSFTGKNLCNKKSNVKLDVTKT